MSENASEYKIELESFAGPLDLLLYLIRRDEIDIFDIPVSRITSEYLKYLDMMTDLNINVAGEFVVMAATLMEIKSRMMAPQAELAEGEEEMEDPRLDLVRQLMEYKRFKEAALELKERQEERAERFTRPGEQIAGEGGPAAPLPSDLTIWALLEAFARLMEQTGRHGPHKIVMDHIPQEALIRRLEERVRAAGSLTFLEVFEGERSHSMLIGMFLALLELVKQQVIRVEQEQCFGEIRLTYVPEDQRPVAEPEPPFAPAEEAPPAAPAAAASMDQEEEEPWPEDDLGLDDLPETPEPDLTQGAGGSP